MFELNGVRKSYGTVDALLPFDLETRTGATTVLIGPSGCGKSTVLRLLNGLIVADDGDVRFDGVDVTGNRVLELRRRMGYVIQEGGLFPHLTAEGNVSLLARHIGWERQRIDARLSELADLTRFPREGLARYPAQLSGGQRQRVSLMRALMLNPDALLLDEPLGALDPMVRYDLQEDLRRIFRTLSKTVVMVTHDLAEAAYFADELILMRDGAVEQRGRMEQLLDSPASDFVEKFVRAQRGIHGSDQ